MKFWGRHQDVTFGLTLRQEALLFLKKKKQKDFMNLGHGSWRPNRRGDLILAEFDHRDAEDTDKDAKYIQPVKFFVKDQTADRE